MGNKEDDTSNAKIKHWSKVFIIEVILVYRFRLAIGLEGEEAVSFSNHLMSTKKDNNKGKLSLVPSNHLIYIYELIKKTRDKSSNGTFDEVRA